jgi:hypothetical protein
MEQERLAAPAARKWTRPDEYVEALIRRRSSRGGRHSPRLRTEPETPRLLLSTVPFLALLGALAVLSVAIMFLAWPGREPQPPPRKAAEVERGVAQRGWFQEAEKQFH